MAARIIVLATNVAHGYNFARQWLLAAATDIFLIMPSLDADANQRDIERPGGAHAATHCPQFTVTIYGYSLRSVQSAVHFIQYLWLP